MFSMHTVCKELAFNRLLFLASLPRINKLPSCNAERHYTSIDENQYLRFKFPKREDANDRTTVDVRRQKFDTSFNVIPDIVSTDEESRFIDEIEKLLKRLRYQHDHWDDAIHGYRETEITAWKDSSNTNVMQRLKNRVFANESTTEPMQRVHVLDLCDNGYVKPHIDSVRFCGNIIAGLSLLSDSVMRLAYENHPDTYEVYALLPRRSLYIMKDDARYQYTHEILSDGAPSVFNDRQIVRQRRVSIVMRNEPPADFEK